MSIDPMTTFEQAEAERIERQDEARREKDYAEAEQAAGRQLSAWGLNATYDDPLDVVRWLLTELGTGRIPQSDTRLLNAFNSDYGTPALLRVIARALESSQK